MNNDAIRGFFRRYGGQAVATYPVQPEMDAITSNREEVIEWSCDMPADEWRPIGPFAESPAKPGEFPERFTDGCHVGHPVTTIIAPEIGWRIPVLLAEIGGVAMRLKGRELIREFFGLERIVSFVTDPFPWSELEAFTSAVSNLDDFPLRVLSTDLPKTDDPIELFDYEKMRKAAYNRADNEMANWEAVALAADPTAPTLVDGRLEPRVRSPKAAEKFPLLVGVIKTHTTNYLHAQGWRTLFDLKPAHRTPYFKIAKTVKGGANDLPVASWYVKMMAGPEAMPNWATVRVEVPWVHIENRWTTEGKRTGFVNRMSRWLIDARCRQPSYARMPVSLEPIVRAEHSLKSLFTPFGVLRNRFLRHAGVMEGTL
jgi:hypothetical protein